MVKFSFLALASAVAAVSADTVAPVSKKTIKLGNRQLRRGDAATEALLKKAIPYKGKRTGAKKVNKKNVSRRAEEEEEEFEIDGTYSLQFSECIDVKTYDEDLFDEDIVSYVQAGQIVAAQSYVLFHVCQEDSCYLDADDDLYMVDLATYLTNVAQFHANTRNDFCEQCEQNEEYCNPEEEEEEEADEEDEEEEGEEEEEEEGEEEDEGRKLKKNKRKLSKRNRKNITRKLANKEYIDCDKCQEYECYADEEDLDDGAVAKDELDEQVSEWIANIAECQETGSQWGDLDLYVGAMCSPYGDGVELAVFANEDCTWYTNQKTFSSVYNPYGEDGDNTINYLEYAEDFIKSAFSEITPCLQKEYAEYGEDDDEDEDEDEEDRYEASEYCQAVMEDNAVSFSNCAADEEEEEEEEEDENAADYSWFTYDIKEVEDANDVCVAIKKSEEADFSGYHVYDEEASGSWYMRNKKGAIVTGDEKSGMSGGVVALIVLLVAGAVGAAGFFFMKAKTAKVETDYQGGEMS